MISTKRKPSLLIRDFWFRRIKRNAIVPKIPLFFIHIPKTAGTSFRNMLYRKIDPKITFPSLFELGHNNGQYPMLRNLRKNLKKSDQKVQFLCGHYPFACEQLLPHPRQTFVFLRDPIARTISNLAHFKRNQAGKQNLSLIEIFDKHHPQLQNLQTAYLCDSELSQPLRFNKPAIVNEEDLVKAKKNLEKCTFVGITEQFDTSIKIAEHILEIKLGPPLKRNVTPAKIKSADAELAEYLRPYFDLDIVLYKYALELFEVQKSHILDK